MGVAQSGRGKLWPVAHMWLVMVSNTACCTCSSSRKIAAFHQCLPSGFKDRYFVVQRFCSFSMHIKVMFRLQANQIPIRIRSWPSPGLGSHFSLKTAYVVSSSAPSVQRSKALRADALFANSTMPLPVGRPRSSVTTTARSTGPNWENAWGGGAR